MTSILSSSALQALFSNPFFVRNLIYGIEDSLISTTGMVVGITFAGLPNKHIIIAALVLIFVEATSMSYGAFLAEESFIKTAQMSEDTAHVVLYAITMLLSYAFAGLIVILPYLLNLKNNYVYSIGMTVIILFYLILWTEGGSLSKASVLTLIGILILVASIIIGELLRRYQMDQGQLVIPL